MMNFKEDITKEELNELPLTAFEGEIVVVDTQKKLELAVDVLANEPVIGFDTETKPSFKSGITNSVALLQLAIENTAFLFRIPKIKLPETLINILSSQNIIKAGAAIHDDIKSLKHISMFQHSGFIELQDIVKDYGINSFSLKKMAGIVLGIRISKSQRLSNWESEHLSEAQLRYAATDAWVSYKIFRTLMEVES